MMAFYSFIIHQEFVVFIISEDNVVLNSGCRARSGLSVVGRKSSTDGGTYQRRQSGLKSGGVVDPGKKISIF